MPNDKPAPAEVAFLATIKPIQSAFQLDGDGDGGQITLTFDRSQVPKATEAWVRFAGELFELVFRPER